MGRLIALAVVSGVALQLAAPPLELWALSFVALAPVLYALHGRGPRDWVLAGMVVGLIHGACLLDAAIKWGPVTAFALTALVASLFALPFLPAGLLARALPEPLRPWAFLFAFVPSWWLVDELLYSPLSLSAPIALGAPRLLAVTELFGAVGLEALVVASSSALAALCRGPRRAGTLASLAPVPLVALVALGALLELPALPPSGTGRITGVQPNVHWSAYAASSWSLERRSSVEARLDALTRQAVARGGTIVWPENGNGLPNAQLERRVAAFRQLLVSGDADLLASGRELHDGVEYLSVFHFTRSGPVGRARKARLVPFAERGLTPGSPTVLETRAGPVGIAVCFDVLFAAHVRALVDGGAELLVVTTDDTSFGETSIPRRHLAHAVLRAAEVGRSLAFVSNEGPGVVYDGRRRDLATLAGEGRAAVYSVELARSSAHTLAHRGLRHLLPAAMLVLLVVVASSRRRAAPLPAAARLRHFALAVTFVPLLGAATDLSLRSRSAPLADLAGDLASRARTPAAIEAIGPLFRQSEPKSCGAAALAFALTHLGDHVFEEQLLRALERDPARGTSMAELERVARARGFDTRARRADGIEALRFGPGLVQLLHVEPEHFVAAFHPLGDEIHLLDPALGAVLRVKVRDLEARWSGYALEIGHRPALE